MRMLNEGQVLDGDDVIGASIRLKSWVKGKC